MLTDEKIYEVAKEDTVVSRGLEYFRKGKVRHLLFAADDRVFTADVQGENDYQISVHFDEHREVKSFSCNCPAFFRHSAFACKHIVAVLKTIQAGWPYYFSGVNHRETAAAQGILDFFRRRLTSSDRQGEKTVVKLFPTLHIEREGIYGRSSLQFLIGCERPYVLKDIPRFLDNWEAQQEISFGKNLVLRPLETEFDELSQRLFALLREAALEERQRNSWQYRAYGGGIFADPRSFKLTTSYLTKFLDIMARESFPVELAGQKAMSVEVVTGEPVLMFELSKIPGGLRLLLMNEDGALLGLDPEFHFIYDQSKIYRVSSEFAAYLKPIFISFHRHRKAELIIPADEASDFFSLMMPALQKIGEVKLQPALTRQIRQIPLSKKIYFDRYEQGMAARIEFIYADRVINPASGEKLPAEEAGKWLLRDSLAEYRLLQYFQRYKFEKVSGLFIQPDEGETYQFLQEALPELEDLAELYFSADFKQIQIQPPLSLQAGVSLNQESDLLEFTFDYGEFSAGELQELLAAYTLKKTYHRLASGAFVPLEAPEFQTAARLFSELGIKPGDLNKNVIKLPKYRALYLDNLARETNDFYLKRDGLFKQMVRDLREPADRDYHIPAGVNGRLREYQKNGFKWLKSLAAYGLSGILADDMGLGKTLQILTFLLSEPAELPSIVVAPTSLIYNWQEEAQKFTPQLQVLVIAGSQEERMEQREGALQAQLVVTSYGLLRRDIEWYRRQNFQYCILDEAQNIKNPQTMNAKAVKQIQAKSYFALTGTPIENSLTELWSVFDFLLPGYLRNHKEFINHFETPIVKNNDDMVAQELRRHIKPFILRRMKRDVLRELPPKIENKRSCVMTKTQQKLYAAWLIQARNELADEVAEHGFAQSRIKILALLTRLRQICCHPSLFIENYTGGSGKLELLLDLLRDAIGNGHRILLFSQFTGMLQIIGQALQTEKIDYYYLDGSTGANERLEKVHSFNQGKCPVFLISLKAGGTGLNLTGADVVIHYDPWWNPAVEEQATDRAYRLGQRNSVQVYKLITHNTIEEKIYQLQQRKKVIIDTLIQPGENFLTKMSEAEIRELFQFAEK